MVKSRTAAPARQGQGEGANTESPLPSERRIISILAVDIVHSTRHIARCDPEDAQAFFDRCFAHVRSAIQQAGGTLVSYEGDGGIAAFGWPTALEDHADHACDAACAIQAGTGADTGPDGRPVQFRIGIHAGLVAVRQLRGGGQSRLDTVGAAVHIAAKLQQSAPPGGTLISAEAVRMCRAPPKLGELVRLPGLDDDVAGWALRGPAEPLSRAGFTARYRSPMIGRQAELVRLANLLPRRGGGSAALVGEPGIGKSRLAAEVVAAALATDTRLFIAFGDAQRRSTAFAIARGLFTGDPARSSTGLRARDRSALRTAGMDAGEIDAIDALLGNRQQVPGRNALRLTETQLARLLARAFVLLMFDRPTMVLVEDLHLVDPESQGFLRLLRLADTPHPLLLLVTARQESLAAAQEVTGSVVLLEPLPRSAMRALVELLWSGGQLPSDPLLDRILNRADGVPLLLEELVRSAIAGGPSPLAFPQTIGSLIHARLTQLSPGAKQLAQALSLLGEYVELELAGEVLGIDLPTLLDQLMELERFALVHPINGNFTHMRHQIIAEACAETIPHGRRRELHRAAYHAITAPSRSTSGRDEQLAYHADGSGDLPRAVEHLWNAALEARRSSATASLSQIFDRALALIGRIGDAAEEKYVDFVLMAFAAVIQRGEFEKMNRHLPRIVELVRQAGRPERISSALSQLGMICWFEGRYAEGLRATEEGLEIARSLGSPALIFSNMIMQTNLLHCLGQVRRAIAEELELCDYLSGELETARLGAPGIPSATALSFMSWFLLEIGDYEGGLAYVERGLAIAMRERDPYAEVLARNGLGRNLIALHRNEDAAACLKIAREIAEYNGYDAIKADLDGRAAIALARSGRATEALAMVEACLRDGMHLRTGQLEVYCLLAGRAEALLCLDRVDAGLEALAEALALARRVQNPCLVVDALGLRARYLATLRPGDPQARADLAEQAAICAEFDLVAWPGVKPDSSAADAVKPTPAPMAPGSA